MLPERDDDEDEEYVAVADGRGGNPGGNLPAFGTGWSN